MEKKEKDSEEKVEEEDLSEIDEIIEKILSVKGYVIFQDILHNNNFIFYIEKKQELLQI